MEGLWLYIWNKTNRILFKQPLMTCTLRLSSTLEWIPGILAVLNSIVRWLFTNTQKIPQALNILKKSSSDTLGQVYFKVLKWILPYIYVLLRIMKN